MFNILNLDVRNVVYKFQSLNDLKSIKEDHSYCKESLYISSGQSKQEIVKQTNNTEHKIDIGSIADKDALLSSTVVEEAGIEGDMNKECDKNADDLEIHKGTTLESGMHNLSARILDKASTCD